MSRQTAPAGAFVVEVTYAPFFPGDPPHKRNVYLTPEDYDALREALTGRLKAQAFGEYSLYSKDRATLSTGHTTLTHLNQILLVRRLGSTGGTL